MKLITYSKIGYNHPSQANWSYGIWKIDLLDTVKNPLYAMSYTVKENFGGDERLVSKVRDTLNYQMTETKEVYPTQSITGTRSMLDMESEEVYNIIKDFLGKPELCNCGINPGFHEKQTNCN